mmetsp:Transcript_38833/g.77006  ORF Transcript_38833/g.77006 Transcript_38833/m.77006 type:complete len:273 (+) Transcript_38833:56-874(+)
MAANASTDPLAHWRLRLHRRRLFVMLLPLWFMTTQDLTVPLSASWVSPASWRAAAVLSSNAASCIARNIFPDVGVCIKKRPPVRRGGRTLTGRPSNQDDTKRGNSGGRDEEGLVQKIVGSVKGLLGISEKNDPAPIAPTRSATGLPATFGLLTGVAGALFKVASGLVQSSQDDVQLVLEEARQAMQRSGQLGSSVVCGPIYSQQYSSMNINGRQTTQVKLQFQVQGEAASGMAACDASVGANGVVDLRDLRLNGVPIDTMPGRRGDVEVIDV